MGRRDYYPGKRGGGGGSSVVKLPKDYIHVGICLLYSGLGFRGLQLQTHGPTHETVEGVLLQALKDVGLVTIEGGKPSMNVNLSRSCRTDRGVHAVRNLVCLYVPPPPPPSISGPPQEQHLEPAEPSFAAASTRHPEEDEAWLNGLAERINARLPRVVRVAKVMRLTASFVPRHCCNRRVYRYLIPLYALLHPADSWETCMQQYPSFPDDLAALQARAVVDQAMSQFLCWNFADGDDAGKKSTSLICRDSESLDHSASPSGLPFFSGNGEEKEKEEKEEEEKRGDDAPKGDVASFPWLSHMVERVQACNRLLQSHVVGSHRFHNFCVDAEVRGKVQHMKMIPSWSDEALRSVQRCEVLPRLYFLPTEAHGPTWEDCHVYASEEEGQQEEGKEGLRTASSSSSSSVALDHHKPETETALPYLPFLVFQIEGSSFLFNMIRKIVGTMLATCRSTRETVWDDLLSPTKRGAAPLAPGPYLYLALSSYHGYDRTVIGGKFTRFRTIQQAWSGEVDKAAESFAWKEITRDILDVDLRRVPPLEEVLQLRARYLEKHRPTLALEDSHVVKKKLANGQNSTSPPSPTRHTNATKAPSEMTVFLRSLRMHNWMWSTPTLPAGCTVGVESNRMAKRRRRQEEEQERARQQEAEKKRKVEVVAQPESDAIEEGTVINPIISAVETLGNPNHSEEKVCMTTVEPSGERNENNETNDANGAADDEDGEESEEESADTEDGWIYLGESVEAIREIRSERRRTYLLLKRSSRPWET